MSISPTEITRALSALYENDAAEPEPPHVVDCSKIAEGWECDVYAFSIAKEIIPQQLIVKIFLGNQATAKCETEFHFMKRLLQQGVPVPAVMHRGIMGSVAAGPFIIMEKIEGRLIGELFGSASEQRRRELLGIFCRLLVDLHAVDWRSFAGHHPPWSYADESGFVGSELSLMEENIARFDKPRFLPVLHWLGERSSLVPCSKWSVLHGDYHASNVLLSSDGSPAIIDWSGAKIGDYRYDLAWTLMLTGSEMPELRQVVFDEYQRISGRRVENMEYFDVLAGARRLLNMSISLTHGAESLGMRPGAEVLMKGNRAHVEYVHSLLVRRTGITLPEFERMSTDSASR